MPLIWCFDFVNRRSLCYGWYCNFRLAAPARTGQTYSGSDGVSSAAWSCSGPKMFKTILAFPDQSLPTCRSIISWIMSLISRPSPTLLVVNTSTARSTIPSIHHQSSFVFYRYIRPLWNSPSWCHRTFSLHCLPVFRRRFKSLLFREVFS